MKFTLIFVLFCLCFTLSFFGRFFYIADLLSCFYFQYFLCAVAFAIYYKWQKHRRYFYVALCVAVASAVIVYSTLPARSIFKGYQDEKVRVLQFNVLMFNDKLPAVKDWVLKQDADILVFQEVTSRIANEFMSLKDAYPHIISSPTQGAFGSMILSRLPFKAERKPLGTTMVDYTDVVFTLKNSAPLHLYELHTLPPVGLDRYRERNQELAEMAKIINQDKAKYIVFLGDLNITPYSYWFKEFEKTSGLVNSMRGWWPLGTWPGFLPSFMRIPIDHMLTSQVVRVYTKKVGPVIASDHMPVITDLEIYSKN